MDRKKILLGIVLVLFALGIAVVLYFIFFRQAPIPPPAPAPVNLIPINAAPLPPTGIAPPSPPSALVQPGVVPEVVERAPGVPSIAQGGVTKTTALTSSAAQFVDISSHGLVRYYDATTDRFYRIDARDGVVPLAEQTFPSVQTIEWSPTDDRAILEFPDGANILYDFSSGTQTTLPRHWEGFSFAPRGDRIAGLSIAMDRENRYLFESDPNGNEFRALEPLGTNADKVDVVWSPNNQVVAFSRTGNDIGDERQQILAIGRNGENFPGIVVEGSDFRPMWSPDGKRILFSSVHYSNDYKPELWIVDGMGDGIGSNRKRLQIDTWADKCTFGDAATVYCAVPDWLNRGYGLEPRIADTIPDSIMRIDLSTGIRSTVGRPENDMTINTLMVAPDGDALLFTSKSDGRLYEMRLR